MEQTSIDMFTQDLAELDNFIAQCTRPNLKRQFAQYRQNIVFSLEDEKRKAEKKKDTSSSDTATNTTNIVFTTVTKYAFDSGDKFVKIYLTEGFSKAKDLPKENIVSKFNKKSFEIQILNLEKRNFKFACANLNKEIDPETSYVKQTSSGLTVFLKKANNSDHWDSLEHKKSLVKSDEQGENPAEKTKDPNAGLMEMMKEMYQSGDPEMKKIIAESFTKAQSGEGMDEDKKKKKDKMSGMPDMSSMADMSKLLGNMGGMGGMPGMEGMGGMPGMPGMEGMGGMPGMEGMDMNKMAEMSKMFANMGNMGGKK